MLSRRPHLDLKEVEMLTQSDFLDDIEIVIETEFRIKVVELEE